MWQPGDRVGVTSITRHGPPRLRSLAPPDTEPAPGQRTERLRLAVPALQTTVNTPRMRIPVTTGTGSGPTPIAAFDAALLDGGLGNFNLIRLSSVIPPLSLVEMASGPVAPLGRWGDRLYVVYASHGTSERGHTAWSGIGWIQNADTGAGLFVEHDADDEETVRADITSSLAAMAEGRTVDFGPPSIVTAGVRCIDQPVAAVTAAVFGAHGWDGPAFETAHLG
jgi:arginine decarboxylase